jgi:VanZ family protein
MIRVLPARMLLPLAYMAGVFFLSSLPASQIHQLGLSAMVVNLGHVPLFSGLAWATLWAIQGTTSRRIACVAAICLGFALLDEYHQTFVPGRYFSLWDLFLDALGIALGIAAGLWAWPSWTTRRRKRTA